MYGAEIWGLDKGTEIEKVHLFALKRFLHIDTRSPNDLVYGELGRYPLYINSFVKCIKYWLQLNRMDTFRLPFKAYKILYNLDSNGKRTWATNVRNFLNVHGFSFVWNNQGVENVNIFLRCLKQRLIDCRWQDWHDHIQNSDSFAKYKLFKMSFDIEPYIEMEMNVYIKSAFTKFRFGISSLACHYNRFVNVNENDLLCRLCRSEIENEIHFLFCCPALSDLRVKYIKPKFYRNPCAFRMNVLMSSKHEETVRNLATYIYLAVKRLRIATI